MLEQTFALVRYNSVFIHCVHPIHAKVFSIQMLLHFRQIVPRVCTLVLYINPRRACTARVTVLGLSFCLSVCLSGHAILAVRAIKSHRVKRQICGNIKMAFFIKLSYSKCARVSTHVYNYMLLLYVQIFKIYIYFLCSDSLLYTSFFFILLYMVFIHVIVHALLLITAT